MALPSPIKVRVFSDQPVDLNIIWIVVTILLIILSLFLGYKYSQKCPDLICPECRDSECPQCNCELDCSTCPPIVQNITHSVDVLRYVCLNTEKIVEDPDDCFAEIDEDEIKLATTNEEGSFIERSNVEPRCINGKNGGEVSYQIGTTPNNVALQIKEVNKEYETIKVFPGLVTSYRYFTICTDNDISCKKASDFYLDKYKLYVVRLQFNESKTTGIIEYSNEYLVDTRDSSEYLSKVCQQK